MKIIDDNGYTWVLHNGRIQCLEGVLDMETPEEIAENGYYVDNWYDALAELNGGGYIDIELPHNCHHVDRLNARLREHVAMLREALMLVNTSYMGHLIPIETNAVLRSALEATEDSDE